MIEFVKLVLTGAVIVGSILGLGLVAGIVVWGPDVLADVESAIIAALKGTLVLVCVMGAILFLAMVGGIVRGDRT